MALTIIKNWKKSEPVIHFLPSSTQAILTRSPCQYSGEIYQLEDKDFSRSHGILTRYLFSG